MDDKKEFASAVSPVVREPMVSAAVRFLRNPKVEDSNDEQKVVFLKGKGLTDEEIKEALRRSTSVSYSVERTQTCAFLRTTRQSRFMGALQAVCNVIVVVFGGGYIIYYVVKTYVLPWLTGSRSKSRGDQLAALQASLDMSVRQLSSSLQTIQTQVAEQQRLFEQLRRPTAEPAQLSTELAQLRSEVASLKGLLLSRRQFAPAPSPPAPSIPSWQMVKTTPPGDADKGQADSSSSGEIVIVSGNNSDNSDQHSDN